jgi:hypothetical protein
MPPKMSYAGGESEVVVLGTLQLRQGDLVLGSCASVDTLLLECPLYAP